MSAYSFTAMVFRHHQCAELGWEWICSFGCATKEDAKASAEESVDRKLRYAIVPDSRSRYRIRVVRAESGSDAAELKEREILNKMNQPYMAERAKWPTLVVDCSNEALARLREELGAGVVVVKDHTVEK